MNKFDFLSEPPQMLFFQNESNKTSFGGILFIIYIIFASSLSIILILDYFLNEKYEVYYSLKRNYVSGNKMPLDDEMDPLLNFSINLYTVNDDIEKSESSKNFKVLDSYFQLTERNSIIQKRPSDIIFYIVYDDNNTTEEDEYNFWHYFEIKYQGFKLQHQESIPLITNESDIYFKEEYPFSLDKTTVNVISWQILKYIENRGVYGLFDGILKRRNEYTSGYIASDYAISKDKPMEMFGMKLLSIVLIENKFEKYAEYRRKKNDILDLIANIGSLFSTFFSVFAFIFKFYSNYIDNYQIIEKLLSKAKKMNIFKKNEIININVNKNNKYQSDSTQDVMSPVNNTTKKKFDFSGEKKEAKIIAETKDKLETVKIKTISEIKNIKKLSFRHFFLNGFYLKCFNRINENKVIDLCNYILSKYISIDLLLYNQIMFENLLKDYTWNNPDLTNINKNKLINRLININ
jgi:hypothetical protein